jgi:hypothetical protein
MSSAHVFKAAIPIRDWGGVVRIGLFPLGELSPEVVFDILNFCTGENGVEL